METSKFEKRRGRVRKKIEALRNGGLQADATPSPSNSVNEGLDLFPDSPLQPGSGFQLSPDFRYVSVCASLPNDISEYLYLQSFCITIWSLITKLLPSSFYFVPFG